MNVMNALKKNNAKHMKMTKNVNAKNAIRDFIIIIFHVKNAKKIAKLAMGDTSMI